MSALWARAVPCVSDFISLKDEYRNMAGGVLPLTNDPMPNINTNKQGWGTDAAGTDLTEGDKYKDLINVKGAKFLDLVNSSSVKIDDADDLKEALKEYDVEMSIAFNDNPDNDEFRKAYIVVITGLTKKSTTPVGPETSGVVKLTGDAVGQATISDDTVTTLAGSGKTTASFTLNLPEWAAPVATKAADSVGHVVVKYDIYVDGQLWDSNKEVSFSGTNVTTGNVLVLKDAKGATTSTQGKVATAELKDYEVLAADNRLIGKKVELRITDVTYDYVRVQYKNNGGELVRGIDVAEHFLTTDKAGAAPNTIVTANIVSTTKYSNATAATYSVTGAKLVADDSRITNASWDNSTASAQAYADGDGYVVVNITGLKEKANKIDIFADKFGSKTLLESGCKIGDVLKAADANTTNAAIDDTVKITVTGDGGNAVNNTALTAGGDGQILGVLDEGDLVTIKVDVAAGANHGSAAEYKVTARAVGVSGKVLKEVTETTTTYAATGTDSARFMPTEDFKVEVSIEILGQPKLESASVDVDNAQLILNFNMPIDTGSALTNAFTIGAFNTGTAPTFITDQGAAIEGAGTKTLKLKMSNLTVANISAVTAAGDITLKTTGGLTSGGVSVKADKVTLSVENGAIKATVTNAP